MPCFKDRRISFSVLFSFLSGLTLRTERFHHISAKDSVMSREMAEHIVHAPAKV